MSVINDIASFLEERRPKRPEVSREFYSEYVREYVRRYLEREVPGGWMGTVRHPGNGRVAGVMTAISRPGGLVFVDEFAVVSWDVAPVLWMRLVEDRGRPELVGWRRDRPGTREKWYDVDAVERRLGILELQTVEGG